MDIETDGMNWLSSFGLRRNERALKYNLNMRITAMIIPGGLKRLHFLSDQIYMYSSKFEYPTDRYIYTTTQHMRTTRTIAKLISTLKKGCSSKAFPVGWWVQFYNISDDAHSSNRG